MILNAAEGKVNHILSGMTPCDLARKMACMTRLNLLVLRCRDMEASRRFYEMLGLCFEKHRHGSGPEHYACEGSVVIELYPNSEPDRDRTGVGFSVGNLEATRTALITAGIAAKETVENPWGLSFVARDPDGRRVEISEAAARC